MPKVHARVDCGVVSCRRPSLEAQVSLRPDLLDPIPDIHSNAFDVYPI